MESRGVDGYAVHDATGCHMSDFGDFDSAILRLVQWIVCGVAVIVVVGLVLVGIFIGHAHAAVHHGMTVQQLLDESGCVGDFRRNPITIMCTNGCIVSVANGATGHDPPRITFAPACRALR